MYAAVQVQNELPVEVLFEIHAALDHLSRQHVSDFRESEKAVVQKAYSHLKRACLDIFKLKVRETIDQYNEIRKLDTSLIDNGEFDRQMRKLIDRIKKGATEARRFEGLHKFDLYKQAEAFDLWEPVYADCVTFNVDFYLNKNLDWARRKGFQLSTKKFLFSLFVTAITGGFLKDPLVDGLKFLAKLLWQTLHS